MNKLLLHLNISKKLAIGFLVSTILAVIIGLIGTFSLISTINSQKETYDQSTLGISFSTNAELSFKDLRIAIRDLYIYHDTQANKYIADITAIQGEVTAQLKQYGNTISDAQDQKYYTECQQAFEDYNNTVNKLTEAAKANASGAEILKLIQEGTPKATASAKAFESLANYDRSAAQVTLNKNRTATLISVIFMIIVIIASFIISNLVSRMIARCIAPPLKKFADFAELMALGDTDKSKVFERNDTILTERNDEIGRLAVSFYKLAEGTDKLTQETAAIANGDLTTQVTIRSEQDHFSLALSDLVSKFHALSLSIASSATQIDSGAKQIADSSSALSQGAAEQAGSIEQLSSSMRDLTIKTSQNAKKALKTNELGVNIKSEADEGNHQIEKMLQAMQDIGASSDNISKVIKTIEDIAFQTNILALNAAVEAARAGEHGKGFAVVADEVRNLAAKSAEAAQGTTSLIRQSIQNVRGGSEIASETAESFRNILKGISTVVALVSSITTASNQQATALEQISQGIADVSGIIQKNAAAAEESAGASEELSLQADILKEQIKVYKLN